MPCPAANRVLLVEDDDTNRLIATAMLDRLGYAVEVAKDGRQAVEAARKGGYALVLMDVMMPELDGLQATRAIRALPAPEGSVPILALAAREDYADCAEAGMNGFIAKPFTAANLAESVATALAGIAAPARESIAEAGAVFDAARIRDLGREIGAAPARELVEVFLADAEERLTAMRGLIAGGETKALARAAHSMKSSAATFGLARLSALAREIEAVAPSAPQAQLAALLDAAEAALKAGREAWRAAAL